MVGLLLIIFTLCLLAAVCGALIALRIQQRSLDDPHQEREAWQQAQEGRQRTWEVRQGKHILDAEKKLADQLKDARREWRDWGTQVKQDHQEWRSNVDLEKELARLPHVEQIELTHQTSNGRLQPKDWRPSTFYKADLRGRDLSHRYLERADLRETQLTEANFYMADLTGASLTGANLQRVSLIGANLSGTDLRGANLSGADLLVADLHNAVLHGTNLAGARNLTPEQLQTAIYDSTTIIDSAIDITLPRIPGVQITPPALLAAVPTRDKQSEQATNTAGEREQSAIFASSEGIVESNTPALAAEIAASTPITSADTGHENTTLLAETSSSAPAPATTTESEIPTPVTADAPVLPGENEGFIPESDVLASEANKKNNTSRKRTTRAKQAAATPIQTLASKLEEANAEKLDAEHGSSTAQGDEEFPEEELLPNKIIQWQARTPKTSPLPGSGEQNKGDKAQKKRGNNLTSNFNDAASGQENQQAQAN